MNKGKEAGGKGIFGKLTLIIILNEKGIALLVISAATEMADNILSVIESWEEKGGRLHFPSVIEHNINYVSQAVRKGINNYKNLSGCYVEFFGNSDYESPSAGLSQQMSLGKLDALYKYANVL